MRMMRMEYGWELLLPEIVRDLGNIPLREGSSIVINVAKAGEGLTDAEDYGDLIEVTFDGESPAHVFTLEEVEAIRDGLNSVLVEARRT